jgi:hypothetical protein
MSVLLTIAGKNLIPREFTRGFDQIFIGEVYDRNKCEKVRVYASIQRKAPYQFCSAKLCYFDKETWTISFFSEWDGRNKETNRPFEHRAFINPDVQTLPLNRENMVIEGAFDEIEEIFLGVLELYSDSGRLDLAQY